MQPKFNILHYYNKISFSLKLMGYWGVDATQHVRVFYVSVSIT